MTIVLTGKNIFELQHKLNDIVDKFVNENGESIERFDGSEITSLDGLIDSVRSISFLEPKKLVIVREFSKSKELIDRINEILASKADSTELVFVDPLLDKRTAFYKLLKKNTELLEFKELDVFQLEKWVQKVANESGSSINASNAKYLIDRVGQNQLLLKSEIDKLAISGKEITKELIIEMTDETPQSKIFTMLDKLFSGDVNKAWELYLDQRAQGEEPQKILAMITWQLQQIAMACFVPERSKAQLIKDGMTPYSASKSLALARNISKRTLSYLVSELSELDSQSKTNADIESAFAVYFSEFKTI
jgi:DNA polymerase-3 subunit delta